MSLVKKEEKLTAEEFIRRYKAAMKAKLSREQFAKVLGILPDSLLRRRLVISRQHGLNLPYLETDGNDFLSQEDLEAYYTALQALEKKESVAASDTTRNVSGFSRYVVTAAQNDTPHHQGFLAAILAYCEHNDAELIVIPYRYKNPTSIWNDNNKKAEWWSAPLVPYIVNDTVRLSDNMVVLGNVKIQPTATEPLSGFDGYTGMDSAILGHPKIQLRTVPTPSQHLPKILTTTGTITVPNYTDSKSGWKGNFHHSLAALVVEIDDQNNTHIRHIHGDDVEGSFYDLDTLYTQNGITTGHRVKALVTGDTHAEFMDTDVMMATYLNEDSIVNSLLPEVIVRHDVEDFYARNHHHRGNDLIAFGKHHFGRNNVEESLQLTADFIDKTTHPECINIIVKSNHDEALDRWLREADPKFDPENAMLYHYLKFNQLKNLVRTDTGYSSIDPFEFWCHNPMFPEKRTGLRNRELTHFLKRDESFRMCDIELGFHGDVGPNGARGSIKAFSKIGPKTIIGHSHSPGIYEGCYQVGVSARLDLEYTSGPSSWLHTHCLVYADGSRTLINIIGGKWRLVEPELPEEEEAVITKPDAEAVELDEPTAFAVDPDYVPQDFECYNCEVLTSRDEIRDADGHCPYCECPIDFEEAEEAEEAEPVMTALSDLPQTDWWDRDELIEALRRGHV